MSLPSVERLEHPQRRWTTSNPPCIPRVRVPSALDRFIPAIAAILANEVTAAAGRTALRTFAFNLLGENSFRNAHFDQAVELFTRMICRTFGDLYTVDTTDIDGLSRDFVALYSSYLVKVYPQLERIYQSQDALDGVYDNIRAFIDLVDLSPEDEIGSTRHAHRNILPNENLRRAPVLDRSARGPANIRPMSQEPEKPRRQVFVSAAAAAADNSERGHEKTYPEAPKVADRGVGSRQRPKQEQPKAPSQKREAIKPCVEQDDVVKGENMDRNKHGVVYFGRSYSLPEVASEYESSIQKLEEAAGNLDLTPESAYPNILTGNSPNDLINTIHSLAAEKGSDGRVYLANAMIIHPLVTALDLHDEFDQLKAHTTFVDVKGALNLMIERREEEDLRKIMGYVGNIDRYVTTLINDYLAYGLGLSVSIDSFMADIEDVAAYISTSPKVTPEKRKAYSNFQRNVLRNMFKHGVRREDAFSEVASDMSESRKFDGLAMACTVTHVAATSQELGYVISAKQKRVLLSETPLLFRLADSVLRQTVRFAAGGVVNYIVTLDNVCWKIYTDQPASKDEMLISLAEV